MGAVALYPNISHEEELSALRKRFGERNKNNVSAETLVELAELVLKINIFNFDEKNLNYKRDTAIRATFAPPYSILFMAELGEKSS